MRFMDFDETYATRRVIIRYINEKTLFLHIVKFAEN